jgi:hypothetical protein
MVVLSLTCCRGGEQEKTRGRRHRDMVSVVVAQPSKLAAVRGKQLVFGASVLLQLSNKARLSMLVGLV